MQIKELSNQVNLPISTIRYYEKLKLIQPRKHGYYKQYTTEIKEQLLTIKKLHTAGLSLLQIQQLFCLNEKEKTELNLKELDFLHSLLTSSLKRISLKQQELIKSQNMLDQMLKKVNFLYENRK